LEKQDKGFFYHLNIDDLQQILTQCGYVIDDCKRANLQTLFNLEQEENNFKKEEPINNKRETFNGLNTEGKMGGLERNLKNFSSEMDTFTEMKHFFLNKKRNNPNNTKEKETKNEQSFEISSLDNTTTTTTNNLTSLNFDFLQDNNNINNNINKNNENNNKNSDLLHKEIFVDKAFQDKNINNIKVQTVNGVELNNNNEIKKLVKFKVIRDKPEVRPKPPRSGKIMI
jgi:hypothetical protein